ncbi:MAG: sulfite exporter TauE/SafE family protein [Desulfitobacterium hafniense]|nr:sulfite exporter TauE/SafE family protein [Desulfitobacterium hafniense]
MYLTLVVMGLVGGVLSGLLGVGGAIIMIPMLLYIPPILNLGSFDMKYVSGMVMVQVMFSSIIGLLIHRKNKLSSRDLILYLGTSSLIFSGIGAVLSKFLSGIIQLAIFACLATFAAIAMLLQKEKDSFLDESQDSTQLVFNKTIGIISSAVVGLLVGIVGAGGGFILIPLMTTLLQIPMKIAIGSSLGIVLMSSLTGFAGKLFTGQIPIVESVFLVLGSLPGAYLGSIISNKLSPTVLKRLLLLLIIVIAIRTWYQVVGALDTIGIISVFMLYAIVYRHYKINQTKTQVIKNGTSQRK